MTVHLVFTPHSDDETLGMGGYLAGEILAGHTVVMRLVTDNQPSSRGRSLFADYRGDLTEARYTEFFNACHAIGVTDIDRLWISEQLMFERPTLAEQMLVKDMEDLALEWRKQRVVFHTVMGERDIHAETGAGTSAHRVCEAAARRYKEDHEQADICLHKVYVYSHPKADRTAKIILPLAPDWMQRKRAAIECYKPIGFCLGYGYASVPDLFDAASDDPREFMERL